MIKHRIPAGFAAAAVSLFALAAAAPAHAQFVTQVNAPAVEPAPRGQTMRTFEATELVGAGHTFFGSTTRGLASAMEHAIKRWGEPNGDILGEEGAGAIIGGLRYGEGKLYTRDYGDRKVFWQGPSLGFDFGGDGARTMMLVYNLASPAGIDQRFAGVDGSVYLVGGFGLTALTANNIVVVPIRSGVGARLGLNAGYLKFTPQPTWNPF
jgi:hypothetical protein